MKPLNVLVIGASYGSLIAAKVAMAGHFVTVVGFDHEVTQIADRGMSVELPFRNDGTTKAFQFNAQIGRAMQSDIWGLLVPATVAAEDYDIAFLAVQEPQANAAELSGLFDSISAAKLPFVSVLNMAPLSFIARLPGFDPNQFTDLYHSPDVWRKLWSTPQTLASPDAQAMKPDPTDPTRLKVTLATNIKCAPFAEKPAQRILQRLADDIAGTTLPDGRSVPVKILATPHLTMPLVKLPMLACGNYRSILSQRIRPICEAVWDDPTESRAIYDFAVDVLTANDVPEDIIVPFDRYADAAHGLTLPSSAARAIHAGATKIERADLLLQRLALRKGLSSPGLDQVIATVNQRLMKAPN